MDYINPDEILDLRGVSCPHNTERVLLKLAAMEPGAILEIILDDGQPIKNVPPSVTEDGHLIIDTKQEGYKWIMLVRKA